MFGIPVGLRITLIAGSLLVLTFMIYSSVKAKMDVHFAVLWISLSACILVIGIWPGLAVDLGEMIGFQSASNFVFLIMIAVLFLLNYYSYLKISNLTDQIRKLNYKVASLQKKQDETNQKNMVYEIPEQQEPGRKTI